MNTNDIERIRSAGLISDEQQQSIIEYFGLNRSHNKLLMIFSIIGGVMVAAGLILVMAANWQDIPDLVKIVAGVAIMTGCHLGGWHLRNTGRHLAVAESLNLTGSLLFLGNIALIGQIFNLSSRPQNAMLLWAIGIAPTAFLLRSKTQHVLTLLATSIWLAYEFFGRTGWFNHLPEYQIYLIMLLCAFAFLVLGVWLKRDWFASVTEKHGLLLIHLTAFPLTLPFFYDEFNWTGGASWLLPLSTLVLAGLLIVGIRRNFTIMTVQWRFTWSLSLVAILGMGWLGIITDSNQNVDYSMRELNGSAWLASVLLFSFCLVQAYVGLLRQTPWFVNIGITFIAVHLITAYIKLFGTMFTTGTVFIAGGVFMIALAVYLEKQRRRLIGQINSASTQPSN